MQRQSFFIYAGNLICKIYGDGTDLAVGSHAHVRPPDTGTGSDNIVHGAFLKVTA